MVIQKICCGGGVVNVICDAPKQAAEGNLVVVF